LARNFLSYPFAPYKGIFSSRSARANGRQSSLIVASIEWALYTANGQSLGNSNPNFVVNMDLNGVGPSVVAQQWAIQSVYIDNENVDFPVYVYFPDTFFAVSCPPNSTGWYQVFTNSRSPRIAGLGISDNDISGAAKTNISFTDALMVPYLDQEIASAVELGLSSPITSLSGSGGGIASIIPTPGGSCYNNGALSILGGGGTGANAVGTLDVYGRFTSVALLNHGVGYTGFPQISASGGQTAPPVWTGALTYPINTNVSYGGVIFRSNQAIPFPTTLTPNADPRWTNSGLSVNALASFSSTLEPIAGGSTITASSNYGARALGDQSRNYINTLIGGVARQNLWDTPFGSGYIILTDIDVTQLSSGAGGAANWQIQNDDGDVLMAFQSCVSAAGGKLVQLHNCNIKIPANTNSCVHLDLFASLKLSPLLKDKTKWLVAPEWKS